MQREHLSDRVAVFVARIVFFAGLIYCFLAFQVLLVLGHADFARFFLRPGGWFAELTGVTDSTTVIPNLFQWAVVLGFNALLYLSICVAVYALTKVARKLGIISTAISA
jgi:hypothetical protein